MKENNSEGSQNEENVDNISFKEEEGNTREIKVLLLGRSGVGKTSILHQLTNTSLGLARKPTTSMDFRTKNFTTGEVTIKLELWDSPGQKQFKTIIKTYYANTQLFFLVYSVSDKDSFNSLEGWLEEVKKVNQNAKFLLVGNKIDLAKERKVSTDEGEEFAKKNEMEFFEVSAKEGTNISEELLVPFIKTFLANPKEIKRSSFSSEESEKRVNEKNSKSSFCDECCTCCPCLKKSEDDSFVSDDDYSLK